MLFQTLTKSQLSSPPRLNYPRLKELSISVSARILQALALGFWPDEVNGGSTYPWLGFRERYQHLIVTIQRKMNGEKLLDANEKAYGLGTKELYTEILQGAHIGQQQQ